MGTMDLPTTLRFHPLLGLPEADIRALLRDDIRRMTTAFDSEVQRMTVSRERFTFPRVPGPFAPGSDCDEVYQDLLFGPLPRRYAQAMIGNNLYKYLHSDRIMDAPVAPALDRVFGSENYKDIKECYDQADSVLTRVFRDTPKFHTKWTSGMSSYPGHYWACIRSDQSDAYVHLDPWLNEKWVATTHHNSIRSAEWSPTHHAPALSR